MTNAIASLWTLKMWHLKMPQLTFVQQAIALNLLKDAKNTQNDVAKMFKVLANTIKKFVRRTKTS